MKDFQGRDVVIGNTVLYTSGNKLATGVVEDMQGDKLVISKDDGGTININKAERLYVLV